MKLQIKQVDQEIYSPTKSVSPSKFRKDKRKYLTDQDVLTEPQEIKMLEKTLRNNKENMINRLFQVQKECPEKCQCSVCTYKRQFEEDKFAQRFQKTQKIEIEQERRLYFYDGDPVQLYISCRNLKDLDGTYDKSDPYVVLFTREDQDGEWVKQGQTEVIFDNLNPNYAKNLQVQYNINDTLYLKFMVFDYDGKNVEDHDFIGEVEMTLQNILIDDSDQIVIYDIKNGVDICGKIIVKAEKDISQNKKDMLNKGEHLRQIQKAEESDYGFILRNLTTPPRVKQGLHINIPATLLFQQGTCTMLVYTHMKEKIVKFNHYQSKKINYTDIRKEMMEMKQEYEQNKSDMKYGQKNFEKFEHRRNLLQTPGQGLPGLQGLGKQFQFQLFQTNNSALSSPTKSLKSQKLDDNNMNNNNNTSGNNNNLRKTALISQAPVLECKECKQQYYQDGKSCKWLCEQCREYYYRMVETACSCKEEGGCRLKVVYKKEDLNESVILKQQIISPQTETDHPAFFTFSKENKHDMIDLYTNNAVQIQKYEEFPSETPKQYIACLQPELDNNKKIKLEFRMSTFKTSRLVGIGICYSTINQKREYLYQKKVYGSNDGYFIFADSSIQPINSNQKDAPKKAFPIRQGDVVSMLFNPAQKSITFVNKRTQQEYKRDDIIFKEGVSFLPCVTLSDKNDLLELSSSVEVSEVSLQTFKKQEQLSILNEIEFQNIMLKRAIHPIWKQIQFIQNYIKLDRNISYVASYTFDYEKDRTNPLFRRALIDIQIVNQEICKANSLYLDREQEYLHEQQLMADSLEKYAQYMSYKIFHFVQTFHKIIILKMKTQWLKDELGSVYFVNANNLQQKHGERQYQTQEQFLKKKSKQAEQKLKEINELKKKYSYLNNSENVKKFRSQLLKFYEGKKMQFGIDLNFDPKQEYKESDLVFKKIYPQSNFDISSELSKLQANQSLKVDEVKQKIAQQYYDEYKKKETQLGYINLKQQYEFQQQNEENSQKSQNNNSIGFSILQEQKKLEQCLDDLNKMSVHYVKNRSISTNQNNKRIKLNNNSQLNDNFSHENSKKLRSFTYREVNSNNTLSKSQRSQRSKISEKNSQLHNNSQQQYESIKRPWTNIETNHPSREQSLKNKTNTNFHKTQYQHNKNNKKPKNNNFINITQNQNQVQNRNPNFMLRTKGANNNIYFSQKTKNSLPFLLYSEQL